MKVNKSNLAKSEESGKANVHSKFYPPNDAGRASHFIARFGQDVRYVPEQGYWFIWNGRRWQIDTDGALERLALQMSKEMIFRAMDIPTRNEDKRNKEIKEALKCGNRKNIQDYLALARVDQQIILSNGQLIPKPWTVAAKNGIVDLRTGQIRSYTREDFVTHTLGCEIDPTADCPRWRQFMREVLPDYNVRRFVQKAVGLSLTGLSIEQIFLFLFGLGANGKTTFLEVLFVLFGGYATKAGYRLFYAAEYQPIPEDQIAELFGRRLVLASETKEGAKLNEHFMKDVTGGETLRGCWKYKHGFNFKSQVIPWISGNHKPVIRGSDDGIWRRVRLIPFQQTFLAENCDPYLTAKLLQELPGIANWAIQGVLLWQSEGLKTPRLIKEAVAQYRTDEDTLGEFIRDCVVAKADSNGEGGIPHPWLFTEYRKWAASQGIQYTMTSKGLSKKLRERGWEEKRSNKYKVVWQGLQLIRIKD